jgi:hypothetical protein
VLTGHIVIECADKEADESQITRPERMTIIAEPVADLEQAASLCAQLFRSWRGMRGAAERVKGASRS